MSNVDLVSNRRRELKRLTVVFLGGSCIRCGWNEHQSGLVPHHVDLNTKSFSIGSGSSRSWDAVKGEARKCLLLCQNCHAVVHATKESYYFDTANIPDYADLIEDRSAIEHKCVDCEAMLRWSGNNRCRPCYTLSREKISWPSDLELLNLVKDLGFSKVAKQLNVTDNAIRHRLKKRQLI